MVRDLEELSGLGRRHIEQVLGVVLGDDEDVAGIDLGAIEERHDTVDVVDAIGGDLTRHDSTEDALSDRHGSPRTPTITRLWCASFQRPLTAHTARPHTSALRTRPRLHSEVMADGR